MDNLSGCGTGIKWSFENALYQKGCKVVYKDSQIGTVEDCYHFEDPSIKHYIVRLLNGNLIDVLENDLKAC